MEKKLIVQSSFERKKLNIIWLKMKLLFVLVFTGSMAFAASSYSQKTRIDLQLKNSSLTEILKSIEKTSEFIFIYNKSNVDLSEKKNISVRDQNIETVLDMLFKDTGVTYKIDDRQVFLYKYDEVKVLPINVMPEIQQPQKIEISGKVTDSKGIPIPGATILAKGTTVGIITDVEGNFKLNVPREAKILSVSFVGYEPLEIPIGTKNTFSVTLKEAIVGLDEVVAIGYGTVRRKDLTGSVASVSGSALKDIPVTSAAQAIVGRLAGVQVTKTEGSPDAEIKIRVRGGGSITQSRPAAASGVPLPYRFPASYISPVSQ
jgi:iron complex outermembrane receptor protein